MELIQPEIVKQRMDIGEKLNLLDVRQPEEHADFNIGGLLLPLGDIVSMQIDTIEDWRNQEIICYCRSGQRSMQAAMMLHSMGFSNVKNLVGGMLAWQSTYGQ
ncbi:MAG: rhodanese-like domain-containing protein [Ferruginibacter sp.]